MINKIANNFFYRHAMQADFSMLKFFAFRRDAEAHRGWRTALALIATFCGLVIVTRLFCKDSLGNSSFWPANGALVAILMLLPGRISAVSVGACLLFNIAANAFAGFGNFDNVLFASLNVFVSAVAAILTRKTCGAATDLSRMRRLAAFSVVCVIAALLEVSVGETLKLIAHEPYVDWNDFIQWSLCDSLGLVITTPAILLLVKRQRYSGNFGSTAIERFFLVVLGLTCTVAAFWSGAAAGFFSIYVVLILVAFRAGPAWVLFLAAGVSIISSAFTAHGLGPLAKLSASGPLLRPDVVQPFLISLIACALPPNNALNDSNRAANRLERLNRLARQAKSDAVKAKIEAMTANIAKSEFIANISHEIRTPLNGVLGMAQVLAGSELTDQQRERLGVIRSSGEVLLALLNDVLDFSKIEAGKLELEHALFDIQAVTASVTATFSAVADAKGLALVTCCNTREDISYLGDSTRVRQILTNLVSNALKFTETGTVTIVVEDVVEGLRIEVSDTGIGIPADNLSKLFAKFEQVDTSTTRKFGGTGLGLSISRDLANLMRGSIEARSTLGLGSTFSVTLPLERRAKIDGRASVVQNAVEGYEPADLRILAAEDNPTNQLVLKTLLAQIGVDPLIVDNGAKALDAWRLQAFDVILMDMQMPVMDGLAATLAIRALELEQERPRVPIIAFTANVMSHQVKSYLDAGMDAVVAKPIEFPKLIEALEMVLAASEGENPADSRTEKAA
jgi:signal transduction histidine kinase/AmiR/NasT family two-component response regulator